MGARWRITWKDARGVAWAGEQRRGGPDLRPLLAGVVDLEPGPGEDACWAALEGRIREARRLGPRTFEVTLPNGLCVVVRRHAAEAGWVPFGASGARRAWLVAHRLRARGLEVARPLGFVERRRAPRRATSYLVMEHLAGPPMPRWGSLPLAERRPLVTGAARFVREVLRSRVPGWPLRGHDLLAVGGAPVLVAVEAGRRGLGPASVLAELWHDVAAWPARERLRFLCAIARPVPERRRRTRELLAELGGLSAIRPGGGESHPPPFGPHSSLAAPPGPLEEARVDRTSDLPTLQPEPPKPE